MGKSTTPKPAAADAGNDAPFETDTIKSKAEPVADSDAGGDGDDMLDYFEKLANE